MKRIFILFCVAAVLALFPSLPGSAQVPGPSSVFQDFNLTDLEGKEKGLYELYKGKGKIVVLNLFATWCPPCRMEIPGFVNLQKKYQGKVTFVGVYYDRFENSDPIKKFIKTMGINYDVFKGSAPLANYVQLKGIPRTYILAPDFSVIQDITGGYEEPEFESILQNAFLLLPKQAEKKKTGATR